MSRKKIFILTTSFLLLVLLVAFIRYRIQDSPEAAIADDYNGYENQDNQPEPQENEAEPDTAYVPPDTGTYDDSYSPHAPAPNHSSLADTPHGQISMQHIRHLNNNYYSRFPFSYQEKRAAAWIVQELLAMGYTDADIYVQEFNLEDVLPFIRWGRDAMLRSPAINHDYNYFRQTYMSQNVILTVPGQSSQVIVVGAHYDTVLYPGASDNASGTALLLESAHRMRYIDNYYTIVYIFFGAEEVGLLGAYYYVNALTDDELGNIMFMVNADVLFEGPYFIYAAGYRENIANMNVGENAITRQWDDIAAMLGERENILLQPYPDGLFLGSDHRVFMDAGLTVMMMYGTYFNPDGSFYFRVLHSYRDCYHYIMERWPDKIEDAMRTFSVFLEEVLLASY